MHILPLEVNNTLKDIIYNNPEFIVTIKNRYLTEELWEIAISQEPELFKFNPNPSKELCFYLISVDASLFYLVPKGKINKRMALLAIRYFPENIKILPSEFITDEIIEITLSEDPSLINDLKDADIYVSKKVIRSVIKKNPSMIKYSSNIDEDLICELLIDNPMIITYIPNLTKKMEKIMDEYYPQYLSLLRK